MREDVNQIIEVSGFDFAEKRKIAVVPVCHVQTLL
jgi:hypothetical protein